MPTSIQHRGFKWTVGDESNPALALLVDETSLALHVSNPSDADTDWNVAADSHPSVYIHSNTTPATDYLKLYHDATNGYVDSVGGNLVLAIAGTNEVTLTASALSPATSDGNALGTTALMWADLFLASGGVINFNNGDVTLTHASNLLTLGGGAFNTGADAGGVDIKAFGVTASAYLEWDASADRLNIVTVSGRAISGEEHALDVTMGGTLSSGDSMVGGNFAVTTTGTAGTWVSGIYAKVTQGATKNVNGYISAAEFEVINSADNVSDNFVLVLNSNNAGANVGSHQSYIALREYGATKEQSLFWFGDQSIGTTSATTMLSTTNDQAATHTIRFLIASTPYWILCRNVAPA